MTNDGKVVNRKRALSHPVSFTMNSGSATSDLQTPAPTATKGTQNLNVEIEQRVFENFKVRFSILKLSLTLGSYLA